MSQLTEELMSLFFMFIGLAVFLLFIHFVRVDIDRQHERDLQRDREFGLREPRPLFGFHRSKSRKK